MGFGGWSRLKRWIKNRLFSAFWPVVRSRVFVKLRSVVSKSLVPVSLCGAGAWVGVGTAWALSVPLGYGALAGVTATAGAFGTVRLYQKLLQSQPQSRFVSVFPSRRERPSGTFIYTESRDRGNRSISSR